MSLVQVGKVIALFYSSDDGRVPASVLSFDEKGVIKDKHHDKDIQRSVLIASLESYKLAASQGIAAPYSTLGENILIDYNPYHLSPGTRVKIGDLVLEINQKCTLCKSLAKTDKALPKILKNDRGIFAKVIKAGTIQKKDLVYLLDKDAL